MYRLWIYELMFISGLVNGEMMEFFWHLRDTVTQEQENYWLDD